MKTKLIIAVLFCGALFSSCGNSDNKNPVDTLTDLLNIQGGVGSPTITASTEGVTLNLNATLSANIQDVLDTLESGAHVTMGPVTLQLLQAGPGKVKLEAKIFFDTKADNTGVLSNIIPSATAQSSYPLNVDDRQAVNLFKDNPPAAKLKVEIIGNNQCHFPYNDNEPITMHATGTQAGKRYEVAFPTNYLGGNPNNPTVAREVAIYLTATGETLDYIFNGTSSVYSGFANLTEWHQGHPTFNLIPTPNNNQDLYYLSIREHSSDKPVKATIKIIP